MDGPDPTLSIDDDRSACSDSWQMHFEPEKGNGNEGLNRGAGIFAVESNTWYVNLAFIVRIYHVAETYFLIFMNLPRFFDLAIYPNTA